MNSSGWAQVIAAAILVGGLAAGTFYGVSTTVDVAVAADAERRARDWAEFMITDMPDMHGLIENGQPNPAQHYRIWQMQQVGDVFRFKLFDDKAKLVLISDVSEAALDVDAWTDDNGRAAKVLRDGRTEVVLHDGPETPHMPAIYAEAYVPVPDADGNIIGVVEVYLDQSPLARLFRSMFGILAMLLAGIFTIVFGGAFAGFLIKRRQAEFSLRQIDFLAQYDTLTGLLNRSGFDHVASGTLNAGSGNGAFATLRLDIDHFKAINEARSHKGGDQFLRHVGNTIRQIIEPGDVAARFSGDEFVILARRDLPEAAENLARRLLLAIAQPIEIDGVTVIGTVSMGVHFAVEGLSLDTRLQRADLALYQAKLEGRNCHRIFSASLEEKLARRRYIESAIVNGISEGRFHLAYQPLLNQSDGSCAGFEALLRLKDADGSVISPAEFIPIAESTGQIDAIGRWVLETAMRAAVDWPEPLFVAVNLSVNQFHCGRLVAEVRELLDKTGLPASRLELEVTESLFISDAEGVGAQLGELRAMGVSIAMDDFGTGFSSLGYLWRFGFDKLKIDRSFVLGIEQDYERAKDILDSIISLSHKLEMKVTAEGIETDMQARLLSELNCDLFQGYLFAKPMMDTDLGAYLLTRPQGRPALLEPPVDADPVVRRA